MQLPRDLPPLDPLGTHDADDAHSLHGVHGTQHNFTMPKSFPKTMTVPLNGNGNGSGAAGATVDLSSMHRDGSEVQSITSILPWLRAFGYTREALELLMVPMAATGVIPYWL